MNSRFDGVVMSDDEELQGKFVNEFTRSDSRIYLVGRG